VAKETQSVATSANGPVGAGRISQLMCSWGSRRQYRRTPPKAIPLTSCLDGANLRLRSRRFAWPSLRLRHLLPAALAIAVGVVMLSGSSSAMPARQAKASSHHNRVYLFRGLVPVFTSGIAEIAARLRGQGIGAAVYARSDWAQLADNAAADYKSGRVRTIVLVGYSVGVGAMTDMATRLGELGVPVKLAISLDPVWSTTTPDRVVRYVNYYISSGPGRSVERGEEFGGSLQNIDVSDIPGIGHLNIDNSEIVQGGVIREIHAAINFKHRAKSPAVVSSDGSAARSRSLSGL